jgi:FKBP-type peptidyl-prolyl cis-trans isomerase
MQQTGTGLRYQVIQGAGKGSFISTGDEIKMNYRVSLLDGTQLYSSDSSGTIGFIVDKSDMASGLHEGVKFMRPGDKAIFIMPSHLAYGLTGDGGKISHYKILVVEAEVLSSNKE